MDLNQFDTLLVILATAVMTASIFRYFKMPTIVGYILAGVLVGPQLIGIISEPEETARIAEFGIVFLLFMIGLEFSMVKMIALRKIVFGFGGMQVLVAMLITIFFGLQLGMSISESIVVGGIVSMSSTAIVSKQLLEQDELHTLHGKHAISILLFQDLAVIPILIFIPELVDIHGAMLTKKLGWSLIKGFMAIAFILALGRWVLRPLFSRIALSRAVEIFTLSVLLVALGCAWITHSLGLSLALGGFLAGMMLAETEYRGRIEQDIRPFRDVLLALFFISIGTQFNIHIIPIGWQWMLLLLAALLLFKTLTIAMLGRLYGLSSDDALRTGLILAHGGEFGFAILTLALSYGVLPADYGQVVLGSILLSMIIAPLMIHFHDKTVTILLGKRDENSQN